MESTDPKVPWVVSYFESLMVQCWYPMTVCTSSFYLKKLFKEYAERTCDDMEKNLSAKLADFGFRGSTSAESAGIGGCANLVHFCISDNVYGNHIGMYILDNGYRSHFAFSRKTKNFKPFFAKKNPEKLIFFILCQSFAIFDDFLIKYG